MTISESKSRELESFGTAGSTLVKTAALSLALVLSQHSLPQRDVNAEGFFAASTEGTVAKPFSFRIDELDVFGQINRVYDELLKNQVELDSQSKHALYANLWDLYS